MATSLLSAVPPPGLAAAIAMMSGPGDQRLLDAARAARIARYLLQHRRRREKLFPTDHSGDPIWDMLLDLFIAQTQGTAMAASSLILATLVSPTTALRRLRDLVQDGILLATRDASDGRRTLLVLTPVSYRSLGFWLIDFADGLAEKTD